MEFISAEDLSALTKFEAEEEPKKEPILARAVPLPYLPPEIQLQILRYCFPSRGLTISSDRWGFWKIARVDALCCIKDFASVVPEAFYSKNHVVIEPKGHMNHHAYYYKYFPYMADYYTIRYPPRTASKWVRSMEYIFLRPFRSDSENEKMFLDQIQWLRKIATGESGFDKLNFLRIDLRNLSLRTYCVASQSYEFDSKRISGFAKLVEEKGSFRIPTRRLEIVLEYEHLCVYMDNPCDNCSELYRIIGRRDPGTN
ncbi:hypothetical protein B0J11DRAFT_538212 [Dendryphion nanum]|uniref:Uncharacterized protein n=1 Tax=Dendryphion nanum TaxID=256645 RepID=A0A9P9DD51_9PLEO|nr:hypothetical protein B0J11DRAFT_538212 [Dendryphion nanum]